MLETKVTHGHVHTYEPGDKYTQSYEDRHVHEILGDTTGPALHPRTLLRIHHHTHKL